MTLLLPMAYTAVGPPYAADVQLAAAKQQFDDFDELSMDFYNGSDRIPGVMNQFSELDDLQIRDTCEPRQGEFLHDLYRCFSVRALSSQMGSLLDTFTMTVNHTTPFDAPEVTDLAHLVLTELTSKLKRQNEIIRDELDARDTIMTVIAIFIIVILILAFFCHLWFVLLSVRRSRRIAKLGMALLRRVPPPDIVNNPAICGLLLGESNTPEVTAHSASSVTFESCPRASLIVSVDEIVEDINRRARAIFDLERRQVIGQKLDTLIVRRPKDRGSHALFETLEEMRKPRCDNMSHQFAVHCARPDDSLIPCRADVEGVPDLSGKLAGFLVFLTEMSEEQQVLANLHAARDRVRRLERRLMPSDIRGFLHDDRSDFSFTTRTVCVVALQIANFPAHLRQQGTIPWFRRVHALWHRLSIIAAHYPALTRQNDLPEVFTAIAGLFSGDAATSFAHASVEFAKDALTDICVNETEMRVSVGISVGGPLLCGLSGTEPQRFMASGRAIEDALALSELSSANRILVSVAVKNMLEDVEFDTGGDTSRGFFVKLDLSDIKRVDSSEAELSRVGLDGEDRSAAPQQEPIRALPDPDGGR
jgi:PAS domain S-box-containing protein